MTGEPLREPEVAGRLRSLVDPVGGLVSGALRLPNPPGDPVFPVCVAPLGDISQALTHTAHSVNTSPGDAGMDGAGNAITVEDASWLCIAEALERYSSCAWHPEQFIWATARELGEDAIDLSRLPRISEAEAADPRCILTPPDPDAPLRWVRGYSLMTGKRVWIPASLVFLHLPFESYADRIAAPISTGCAAHTDVYAALASGLCEVIERDSIALTWLQRLALPRIELDKIPADLRPYIDRSRSRNVQTYLFDATTDVGVPTVYSVEVTPHHDAVRTVVMCATDPDPVRAIGKVLREAASGRIALRHRLPDGKSPDSFSTVHDGALYMGAPERADAFDFLLDSPWRAPLSSYGRPQFDTPRSHVGWLLRQLASQGMNAYAVDITSDEAERIGMWVVKAIVPDLMPLSFIRRAQYRGHPRLYRAPAAMGHPVATEEELNPWPQPFA
ncbi:hypothetical protein ACZ90_67185 [Streptomyces albus subsp. albus]|nr:hypothetical protein ACZ90_67185 [Streptomyces albus subsp. albus]